MENLTISEWKGKIIVEHYDNGVNNDLLNKGRDGAYSIKEYVEMKSETDPYRGLFDEGSIQDFKVNLTEDQIANYFLDNF